jgi:hypothetical protein
MSVSNEETIAQKQEIYHFCHSTPREIDQSLLQMKFEALMAEVSNSNVENWNLGEWSCYESLDRASLIQRIEHCLMEHRAPASQFYPLENALLLAFYFPVSKAAAVSLKSTSLPSRLGFSNFLAHLAPIDVPALIHPTSSQSVERPRTPVQAIAYNIGDSFFRMNIQETFLFPDTHCVLSSQLISATDTSSFASISLNLVCLLLHS